MRGLGLLPITYPELGPALGAVIDRRLQATGGGPRGGRSVNFWALLLPLLPPPPPLAAPRVPARPGGRWKPLSDGDGRARRRGVSEARASSARPRRSASGSRPLCASKLGAHTRTNLRGKLARDASVQKLAWGPRTFTQASQRLGLGLRRGRRGPPGPCDPEATRPKPAAWGPARGLRSRVLPAPADPRRVIR